MNPKDKGPGRFYQLFKVHKDHEQGNLPPGRPIISGNGCLTENVSLYVEHHSKPLVPKIDSYLKDTPDFLRTLDEANNSGILPDNAILVSIDAVALYTNIRKEDGLESMEEAFDTREDQAVPTSFLVDLMDLVASCNIFEFNKELFIQLIGAAMGSRCIPNYANLFMAGIDKNITDTAATLGEGVYPMRLFKRFLDDIFTIWTGSIEDLERFLVLLNTLHPTIKFTATYTCPFSCDIEGPHDCFCHQSRSINFLDTTVTIKKGKLVTDLYKKPTDRCQYLLPSSAHPSFVSKNIPYSLALRIVRICSEPETLDRRLSELKQMLLGRDYRPGVINSAIERAKLIPRTKALEKIKKKPTDRVTFVMDFAPQLPSISGIIQSGWRVMARDPLMKKVFPEPPMVAWRRPKSIRDKLIKTKVPVATGRRSNRDIRGMKRCNKPSCAICPYVKTGQFIRSTNTGKIVTLTSSFSCETSGIVYIIHCQKCFMEYIGQTGRTLAKRFSEHMGYVRNKLNEPTGKHFNLVGHSISDMEITILEKVHSQSRATREVRESYFIQEFQSELLGINEKK